MCAGSLNLSHCRRLFSTMLAGIGTILVGIGLLALQGRGMAAPAPDTDGPAFFEKNIRPVLVARCYRCHSESAGKRMGGLALDSADGLRKGGQNGAVLLPGQPGKSRLLTALRYTDAKLQMPPGQPLSAREIDSFEAWITMGAPDPRRNVAPITAAPYTIDWNKARQFWAFQPVKNVNPPNRAGKAVAGKTQAAPVTKVTNPIDSFLLARLEARGRTFAPPADRRTLLRRVTYDLIGLPPTPEEVDAFVKDSSPNAYAKVVDRLLASPQYGEHWGRHWLDLVRYADTSGCNSDFPVPDAYRYRNYVIDAFNADKPYHQFVQEQIAGDLLPARSDAERRAHSIATGYLAIARRFGSQANEFHLTLEDTIDNVGKTFLGLSVSCARCHDHKFDPILSKDYYALYGIFNSTRYAFPGTEVLRHPKDFVPLGSAEQAAALSTYQAELADLDVRLKKLSDERLRAARTKPMPGVAANPANPTNQAIPPGGQPAPRPLEQIDAELKAAKARQQELEGNPPQVEKAYAVVDGTCANAKIQIKGDPKILGEEAPRGFLQILGGQTLPSDEKGSGRRELAQWLTDPYNPLTARVMVNRIWQYHFGKGIVQTPSDFGARGKAPTHPELLDYLATRFVQSGWSIKAMHRLMLLSRAYQQTSADDPKNALVDVNNDLLWRFNRRRLSAEEVRDSMLAISGTLDPTPGEGHPFPPEAEWRYTQHKQFVAVYETRRRSVYLMQQRIKKQPFLEVFDGADPNVTTPDRPISTTPIQALFMMNDPFAHEQAGKFADRVCKRAQTEPEQIDYAYRLAFGRPARGDEIQMGTRYLQQCREDLLKTQVSADQQAHAALTSYLRVLLSSNEFMFVD